MTKESKYFYQKRIAYLEEQNKRLSFERNIFYNVCSEIYDATLTVVRDRGSMNVVYILEKLKAMWVRKYE